MLYYPPPETHAIYLDHSPTGVPRIFVTLARKGKKGSGKRVFTLIGIKRDAVYNALSDILYDHTGERLRTVADDLPPGEYHRFNEYCANQMLLAMHIVRDASDTQRGGRLADAIARQHDCEAGWWYTLYTNRHRPRKVIQARAIAFQTNMKMWLNLGRD